MRQRAAFWLAIIIGVIAVILAIIFAVIQQNYYG